MMSPLVGTNTIVLSSLFSLNSGLSNCASSANDTSASAANVALGTLLYAIPGFFPATLSTRSAPKSWDVL